MERVHIGDLVFYFLQGHLEQVKCWKYPWPNLWQIRDMIIHTGLEEVLIILFLPTVVVRWKILMVLLVVAVLHTTRQMTNCLSKGVNSRLYCLEIVYT
uniref:Uncharacterized protein n=1 Tax=Setaria italica TaxID=4555 RepID=K3Y0B0_SETIT